MTWYTDDRHLYWEQRRLDQMQAEALAKLNAAKAREAAKEPTAPKPVDEVK